MLVRPLIFLLISNSTWIIDFGDTDHMTFDSRQVSSLNHSSQKFVSIANDTSTPISKEGFVTLTDTLNLDFVLIVSSLDYSLLSISQITKSLSCIVIFWSEFCVFKDIQSRRTIGCGIRQGKLYYLDLMSKSSDRLRQDLMVDSTSREKTKKDIWLWQQHLGHASFG